MTAYAALADLKAYLDIPATNTDDDQLLQAALDAATAIIDTQTHRTFVSAVDETHYHDALSDVEGSRLWLKGDLAVLTSVTNGDGQLVAATAYIKEPSIGTPTYAITLKRNSGLSWTYIDTPEQAIAVAGRWAYSVLPPSPIVQATKRLSGWLYRQRANALDLDRTMIIGNTTLTPAQLPVDVWAILKPYAKALP
jgi:hypothetical protein